MREAFKIERFKIFLVIFLTAFFLFSLSCEIVEEEPQSVVIKVYGKVKDTFSGKVLSGVNVRIKTSSGDEYETETDENGNYEFEFEVEEGEVLRVKLYFNFDRGKEDYIPSIVSQDGEDTYIPIDEDTRIDNDLVKKYDIFLKDVLDGIIEHYKEWYGKNIDEEQAMSVIVGAYRGRGNGGLNQVWVTKPEKWIVYDPNHVLDEYDDPKDNPVFNNIMEGFRAIEDYTNGFIRAPYRDEVEIRYKEERTPDGAISFKITDGEAYAFEDVNSNNEIYRSGAGAGPGYALERGAPAGELCASVQGGDSESWLSTVFDGNPMNNLDRIWGKFNYKKREPGSRIILKIIESNSYGFTYETRDFSEIQKLNGQQ